MHIALGVTGCIGAYKAAELVRLFQKKGISGITAILTKSARNFITPHTFDALTNQRTITDMWDRPESREISHISIARRADCLLVAPATANIIGKFASGVADDFLSTLYLATEKPVIIAPAMNKEMWNSKAVRRNIEILKGDGVHVINPDEGYLACGELGAGRLASLEKIVDGVIEILKPGRDFIGKKFVVTAGPTREHIDAVRYLSNPSSGKMGFAIAENASARGADVTLISGPVELRAKEEINLINTTTALEMRDAVNREIKNAAVLVMTAAVSDFRPEKPQKGKIKKDKMPSDIKLTRNPDILAELKDNTEILRIGFAAEADNLKENALKKMKDKNLDMIVANNITAEDAGFAKDTNKVLIISRDGTSATYGPEDKTKIASNINDHISKLLGEK